MIVALGPPFLSQEVWPVPSLHRIIREVVAPHSIAVTRKVPSEHLIVGVCVGEPGVVVVGALGAQELPFQNVFIAQPPGGAVGGTIGAVGGGIGASGAGPPLFWQLDCVVPSLQRTAWALGASKPIKLIKTSESARRSDEAALKRFITSSKAGHLG